MPDCCHTAEASIFVNEKDRAYVVRPSKWDAFWFAMPPLIWRPSRYHKNIWKKRHAASRPQHGSMIMACRRAADFAL